MKVAVVAVCLLVTAHAFAADEKPYTAARTPDGKPDLQGTWANNNATPLERPKMLEGRALLTNQEVAALKQRYAEIFAGDGDAAFGDSIFEAVLSDIQKYKPTTFDVQTGNYNAFWLVERDFDNRTSLITDPPDGRMPPVLPQAATRQMVAYPTQSADGPEDRGLTERCITFGVPDVLAGYNSYYQIVQTPTHVVFLSEMAHDARIIPLDGRSFPDKKIQNWNGEPRGRWEGDTLVVDVTHFNDRAWFDRAGNYHSDALKLTERYTMMSPDVIWYEVTIEDPNVFTRPWQIAMPLYRRAEPNMQLLEFRCNEFVEEFMYGNLRKEQLVRRWEGETMTIDVTRKVPPGDRFYEWYSK
jgi:hypothetical protein